jgi:hypothetical protein
VVLVVNITQLHKLELMKIVTQVVLLVMVGMSNVLVDLQADLLPLTMETQELLEKTKHLETQETRATQEPLRQD